MMVKQADVSLSYVRLLVRTLCVRAYDSGVQS